MKTSRIIIASIFLLLPGTLFPNSYEKDVKPFLSKYCFDCHGEEKQKAHLRFDQFKSFESGDHAKWTLIYEQLLSGDMPPKKKSQPSSTEKSAVLKWIEKESEQILSSASGGTLRRLNRRELSAALQHVTGLKVDYTRSLPEDGKVGGFDTGAEGLQDAADSVAQVLNITRQATGSLRFLEEPKSTVFKMNLREQKDPARDIYEWKKKGIYMKRPRESAKGLGLLIEPKWLGDRTSTLNLHLPVPESRQGLIRVRFSASKLKSKYDNLPNPHLWFSAGGQKLDYVEITADADKPQKFEYHIQIDQTAIESRGLKININNRVEIPYFVDGFENEDRSKGKVKGGTGPWRPSHDKKLRGAERPAPYIIIHDIEIEIGWQPQWLASSASPGDSPEYAKALLSEWMTKAWRRPVADSEIDHFLSFYEKLRTQNKSFDDAMRASFHSVLMSAPFRYLATPYDKVENKAQYAIASRLSFMLNGTPPDEKLLQLAAQKQLRNPEVLNSQVERLLANSSADNFFTPFVIQWLEMNQPITQAMDFFEKQDFRFGRFLKSSMRRETVEYIARLLKDNRPASEIIKSDWTMMNNVLAYHYNYEDINGGHLRPVNIKKNDPRGGGILSHAGIQSMLCWMGENWVIYRGSWALRHILDNPPPPPPLEVPELDPSSGINKGKTPRQLLKQHQEDENCSVCHRKIDPLGFAFQNFDLSGRWRDLEYEKYQRKELDGKLSWKGTGKSRPVDAAGKLPGGEEFKNFDEFKDVLIKHYMDEIVRGIMKNFTLYGTGRKPYVKEMKEINARMSILKEKGYPMQDVLKAVVTSKTFLGIK